MQALGLIETEGVLAAVVSVDTMLKAADVKLVDKIYVGGGLVSVAVTGDVGAVKVAIEAGAAAVNTLDSSLLISQHVIPRPQEDIKSIIRSEGSVIDEILSEDNLKETKEVKEETEEKGEARTEVKDKKDNKKTETEDKKETKDAKDIKTKKDKKEVKADKENEKKETKTEDNKRIDLPKIDLNKLKNKKEVDNLVNKHGIEVTIEALKEFKVVELRKLARKYEGFGIKGREISRAGKKLLLAEFRQYYGKDN